MRIPFFDSNDVRVDYELHVPPSVALELRTVNGRIETRGVDSEVEASSVNGTLDLETGGSRELVAHTVNGRGRARFVRDFQGAQLKTVNGSVEAVLPPTASFACDLSQVNGDFEASFPLNIHSHPGRREPADRRELGARRRQRQRAGERVRDAVQPRTRAAILRRATGG